ncbi:MAG: hypothetical protein AVDCRST_MAG89-5261, partial [uncultured Gemmatimonadetes bacterium]
EGDEDGDGAGPCPVAGRLRIQPHPGAGRIHRARQGRHRRGAAEPQPADPQPGGHRQGRLRVRAGHLQRRGGGTRGAAAHRRHGAAADAVAPAAL